MNWWKLILNFFLIILLQVAVLNEFLFDRFLNPYVYVLYILLLPTAISRSGILIIAFVMGLSIDVFENSAGVHAAASVFLAYARPLLFRILSSRVEGSREDIIITELGSITLAIYALMGVFLHHLILFLIESFSFLEIGTVLARTAISAAFTYIFVVLFLLWNHRRRRS